MCAVSLDGKLSSVDRAPVTWTSRADRRHMFALRDQADAILIGAGTLRAEDPPLLPDDARRAARVAAGLRSDPIRVAVTRGLDVSLEGRALKPRPGAPVVLLGTYGVAPPAERAAAAQALGHEVLEVSDLASGLAELERRHGVARAVCEGGGELNAALLAADLVDEIHLTVCPVLFGGAGAPTLVDGPGLAGAPRKARLVEVKQVGEELFLRYALRSS